MISTTEPRPGERAQHRTLARRTARSSRTSTTTRRPTRTGSTTSSTPSARRRTPRSAGRTSRRRTAPVADAVANAPGGPIHVLLSDTVAEHIPGCNMAFRRDGARGGRRVRPAVPRGRRRRRRLLADPAGGLDDRLQPGGVVWHHRRASIRGVPAPAGRLRQGRGAARAQVAGEVQRRRPRDLGRAAVRHGRRARACGGAGASTTASWGSGLFQRLYQPAPGTLGSLPLMPEWSLVVLALAGLSLLGLAWTPLLVVALPLFAVAAAFVPIDAALIAARADLRDPSRRATLEAPRADRGAQRAPAARRSARENRSRPDAVAPARPRQAGAAGGPDTRVWSEHWVGAEDGS